MASGGALGDCNSHFGLNSMRTDSSGSVRVSLELWAAIGVPTFRSHVLEEESPVRLADEAATELLLSQMVNGLEQLVELIDNVGFAKNDQLLVDSVLAKGGLDDGVEEALLQEIVV